MKKFFKWLIILVGVSVTLLVVGIGTLFWIGKGNTDDVKTMCNIQNGTSIEQVMKRARELGFSEGSQGALGSGFVVFVEGQNTSIRWNDDALPGVQNGKVQVGKTSLPPFLRNYCELTFQNRKVISTRGYTID